MTDMLTRTKTFWDEDAGDYDRIPQHYPTHQAEWAAWAATVRRLLPPAPARVLDAGAGTGFLSIICARLGHEVTATDLSSGMLAELRRKADDENLDVETVQCPADDIPPTRFDVIVERHLLWTLADPTATLRTWREGVPGAQLVLFESLWGDAADPKEAICVSGRKLYRRLRGESPNHHAEYPPDVRRRLPLGNGTPPATLLRMLQSSGWRNPRLERIADVEWASRLGLGRIEYWMGVTPSFALSAE